MMDYDISDETLDDMEVQHFYDVVEQRVGGKYHQRVPVSAQDVLDDLQQLKRLHDLGHLDKYPPLELRDLHGTLAMSSAQRKDSMYYTMSNLVYNKLYGVPEGRIQIADIESNLRRGLTTSYELQIETLVQKERLDEMNNNFENMSFEEYASLRMSQNLPFDAKDISCINRKIQKEIEAIASHKILMESNAYSVTTLADLSDRKRTEQRFDDLVELPAYVSGEIGVETPDDLRGRADDMTKMAEQEYEDAMLELYAKVYKVETYQPLNRNRDERNLSILTEETRNSLGEGYVQYVDEQFEATLTDFKNRHTKQKATGLFGINLAQDRVQDRSRMKSRVAQADVSAEKSNQESKKLHTTKAPKLKSSPFYYKEEPQIDFEDTVEEQEQTFGEDD